MVVTTERDVNTCSLCSYLLMSRREYIKKQMRVIEVLCRVTNPKTIKKYYMSTFLHFLSALPLKKFACNPAVDGIPTIPRLLGWKSSSSGRDFVDHVE